MRSAEYWIKHLNLAAHPEGGFYKESYRSAEKIMLCGLPSRFDSPRNFSTAIYFLLRSEDRSLFHRIKSDELWHFHYGSSLNIYILSNQTLTVTKLGPNVEEGDQLQIMVPANSWFGAQLPMPQTYTLASCTVAPGFDFSDFELGDRVKLRQAFPQHGEIIDRLTL
jgi:predicted cupin superfamily sugar epimerase